MRRHFLPAIGLLVLVQPAIAQGPANAQQSITYVQKLQTKSGGFLLSVPKEGEKPGEATLRATSAAVRALHYLGGKVLDKQGAVKFVESCYDEKSGGFANTPGGKPDLFVTAVGIMVVPALDMETEKYAPGVIKFLSANAKNFEDIRIAVAGLESIKAKSPKGQEWLESIEKMQNADGTFGKGDAVARETGSAVVAILRLGGKLKQPENALKALKEGQRLNGGFGKGDTPVAADMETSYRVMRAFHMLKAVPENVEGLRSYVEKCRNKDGGYSLAPAQESNVAGTYYAAIIHYWLKDKK